MDYEEKSGKKSDVMAKTFLISTLSGGLAGLTVDVTLYPVDAFKTRLQSASGFWNSGGFSKPYAGISAIIVSSIPSAALFFAGYESTKHFLRRKQKVDDRAIQMPAFLTHMIAGGIGEVSACLVRVPCEVVKQRTQAKKASSVWIALRTVLATDGPMGLYRGFRATIARDVPFAFIQYPLWEYLKNHVFIDKFFGSAMAGFVAGGVTAAITTPLDVVKTRIMLSTKADSNGNGLVIKNLKALWNEGGFRILFSGVAPRVFWISIGGGIFLGSYEYFRKNISSHLNKLDRS